MLSGKKYFTSKIHQPKNIFLKVIHPEKSKKIAIVENGNLTENKQLIEREYLVSWLFLIGSLMFLFDGFLELRESISIHVVIHITASILFTIGSVLFIPTNKK